MNATEPMPPFDIAAEEAVIAAILVDPTAMDAIQDLVEGADFHRDQNRLAFDACRALWLRSETINEVTLAHELSRREKLDEAGGIAYLGRIVGELPTPVGVEHYARIVKRDSTYRALISVGSNIVRLAYVGGPDLDGVLRNAEAQLATVDGAHASPGVVTVAKAVEEFWEVGDMHTADAQFAIRSGFSSIDALVGGFQSGNLVIVAARPSVGKSALLLNLARNAAIGQNARVVVCTLEMNRREWAVRLISRESGIDSKRLRPGFMDEFEERRAMTATGELAGLSILLADATQQTPQLLRGAIRRAAAQLGGVDLVLVDYLQLMSGTGKNRYEEVTEISRALKVMAGEFNVPIVAAAQLSRAVEGRRPPMPQLSDLRDSGAIEQDADVVCLLYRPLTSDDVPGAAVQVLVAKNRNGPLGSAWLRMTPATSLFEELNQPSEDSMGF